MKKALPYLLGLVILGCTVFLFLRKKSPRPKKVSTFISLSKHDKSPYGTYVFYNSLKNFFPKAEIRESKKSIYEIRNLGGNKNGKLYIMLMPFLNTSEFDLNKMMDFVEEGNTVFISTLDIGYHFEKLLNVSAGSNYSGIYPFGNAGPFNMKQTLHPPAFRSVQIFSYPGVAMEGYFFKTDSVIARTLGRGNNGRINFVHLRRGKGDLFVHMSPIALSNYFLLYQDNYQYLEQIFSLFPNSISKAGTIVWDNYYSQKANIHSNRRNRKPGWFTAIMKEPAFRAGIFTALLLMVLYTISEIRRHQRMIPVIKPPVNDSMEFVKTVGLLYYQRKDHENLAKKMSAYFLEQVRNKYRIFAKELDGNFIKEMSYKSGASEQLVALIVNDIKRVNNNVAISDTELITMQKNIEAFYEMSS